MATVPATITPLQNLPVDSAVDFSQKADALLTTLNSKISSVDSVSTTVYNNQTELEELSDPTFPVFSATVTANSALTIGQDDFVTWTVEAGTVVGDLTNVPADYRGNRRLVLQWNPEEEIVSSVTLNEISFTVGTTSNVRGLDFSPNGLKLFYYNTSDQTLYQRPLTSSWSIATAGAASTYYIGNVNVKDFCFRNDGLRLYVLLSRYAGDENNYITQYNLSSAWEIGAASFAGTKTISGNISAGYREFRSLFLGGTNQNRMFIASANTQVIYSYDLSISGDITSMSNTPVSLDISRLEVVPESIKLSSDGLNLYICGQNSIVYQYKLGTAWQLSTATFLGENTKFVFLNKYSNTPTAVALNATGDIGIYSHSNRLSYLSSSRQFEPGTTSLGNTTTYSSYGSIDQINIPYSGIAAGLYIYTLSFSDRILRRGGFGAVWNQSTVGSVNQTYTFDSSFGAAARCVRFSSDGTKLFYLSSSTPNDGTIWVFNMSTAWSITTLSYASQFVTLRTSGVTTIRTFNFSQDGQYLYAYFSDGRLTAWRLTTPWNILTLTELNSVTPVFGENQPNTSALDVRDMIISNDGKKILFLIGNALVKFELTTTHDLTTILNLIPYDSGFSKLLGDGYSSTIPTGIALHSFGTKLYSLYKSGGPALSDKIVENALYTQYNLGTNYSLQFAVLDLSSVSRSGSTITGFTATVVYSSCERWFNKNTYKYTVASVPPTTENNRLDSSTINMYFKHRNSAPLSNTSGETGDVYIDDKYFYVKTQSAWKRASVTLLT